MLQGAIFDLDGTLLDSMHIWAHLGENYLRNIGCMPTPDLSRQLRTMSKYDAACFLKKEYCLPLSTDAIIEGINGMIRHFYQNEVMPKPGAEALLLHLQRNGVRMCVATATDRSLAEAALQRCGLMDYFSAIITCDEAASGKDQPDIYRQALAHMGTEKSQTAVFEDAVHALGTARADGFITVAVYDPSEADAAAAHALADWYLPDYTDAPTVWNTLSEMKGRNAACKGV